MKPLDAKLYFRFQVVINSLIILVIFLPLSWFFAQTQYAFFANVGIIALLYFLFFHVLDGKSIALICPKCAKQIDSITPWVCGFCQRRNAKTTQFSLLHKCEHCEAEPKAYRCHHCEELMFLSKDEQRANFAYCINLDMPKPITPDASFQRKEAKEAALHEIEMTELAGRLELTKKRVGLGKKSTSDEIEESFQKFFVSRMGREEFAKNMRPVFAEKYKDDVEMLEKANDIMIAWLREET